MPRRGFWGKFQPHVELEMRIYLTQHGLAVPKDVDPDRPLNEQGRKDVQRLADFLESSGVYFDQAFHSGKTRAEQTAKMISKTLLRNGTPRARTGLNPKDVVEPFASGIAKWSNDTLIVGHLPFLARLATLLLGSEAERPILAFLPGSMACLERESAEHWVLCWMIRPGLLVPART